MKILFYETKKYELDIILGQIPSNFDITYFQNSLKETTYIDKENKNTDAISCFVGSELNEKTLSKFEKLKYIFLRCTGYSNVDLKYCKEKNIKVYNVPNYGSSSVAEYVFALLLSFERKILTSQKSLKNGMIDYKNLIGSELNSKTLGIIGVGAIGRKVINIAHGFDMEVIVYDINPKGAYHFVELNELLKKSDFIIISCPLTEETKSLINKHTLSKMKNDAVLINVARGEIVDTKALYEALINKKLKGALLDVIECEQILCENYQTCSNFEEKNEHCMKKYFFIQKLMQLDNVIITPHNAYNTQEAVAKIIKITLENIRQVETKNGGVNNLILL